MSRTIRDVHNGQSRLARYRAERLLRLGFPALRSKVLAVVRSKLRAAGVSLDRADLEACYAQAWQGLYAQALAGETVESPEAWLVLVTFRRAIDEARAVAARARPAVGEDVASGEGSWTSVAEPDLADALDDRDRLRSLFEALRARLSERECEAASLCYLQGLTRAQAAAQMGIGERRMAKLMEGPGGGVPGVAGKVGQLLETIRAGRWCEQQSSLMRAYAFGLLDPDGERHTLAVAHTRECPACRAHVAALRGLASVLPPLPLLLPLQGAGGRAAPKPHPRPRLPGAPRLTRRALRQVANTARQVPGSAAAGGSLAAGGSAAGGSLAASGSLVAGGSTPASGSAAGGWLASGRLAAQIVACGVLAAGGGYALLGSRAHGNALHRLSRRAVSPRERTGTAAGRLAGDRIPHARASARPSPHTGVTGRTSASRRTARPSRTPVPPARARLSSPEFSPERTSSAPRPAPPATPAGRSEFGIE